MAKIKNRTNGKGFIVLISSVDDLKIFGIQPSETTKSFLYPPEVSEQRRVQKFWPGKVSVVLESGSEDFCYLCPKDKTIAFRLPDKPELIEILKQTGPLVAPSANPEGQPPAKNIAEAEKYFGSAVDFYEDNGNLDSLPSTLVRIVGDKVEVLRAGAVKIH